MVDEYGNMCYPMPLSSYCESGKEIMYLPQAVCAYYGGNKKSVAQYSNSWNSSTNFMLLCLCLASISVDSSYKLFCQYGSSQNSRISSEVEKIEFLSRYRAFRSVVDYKLDRGRYDALAALLVTDVEDAIAYLPILEDEANTGLKLPWWWALKRQRMTDIDNRRSQYIVETDYESNVSNSTYFAKGKQLKKKKSNYVKLGEIEMDDDNDSKKSLKPSKSFKVEKSSRSSQKSSTSLRTASSTKKSVCKSFKSNKTTPSQSSTNNQRALRSKNNSRR
ncbi:hypothetical protein V1511DRAFT_360745 [Dipodascopsis uninucleata]